MAGRATTEVAILGAGYSGLWLALMLARSGIDCVLIDELPVAGYASTSNQGWLHSGALYATTLIHSQPALQACNEGFHTITAELEERGRRNLIRRDIAAYFLFTNDRFRGLDAAGKVEALLDNCRAANVPIKAETVDLDALRAAEPVLAARAGVAPRVSMAVKVEDSLIQSRALLQLVAGDALEAGAGFRQVATVRDTIVERQPDHWQLHLDDGTLECSAIVLACGPCIRDILHGFEGRLARRLQVAKVATLALSPAVTNSMLIVVQQGAANLIPFPQGGGATSTLLRGSKPLPPAGPLETTVVSDDTRPLFEALASTFPALRTLCQSADIAGHAYATHRVETSPPAALGDVVWDHSAPDLGSLPGLFSLAAMRLTSAPSAARRCFELLIEFGVSQRTRGRGRGAAIPPVAQDRYSAEPSGRLVVDPATRGLDIR